MDNQFNNFGHYRKQILIKRYFRKDECGRPNETEGQLYRRVASTAAKAEGNYGATPEKISAWEGEFNNLMTSRVFFPNSPTLMNAGREQGLLSACFVLSIEDSIEGIFDTVKFTALIQKAGGGTGYSLDKLRPTGDIVRSSGGTTSGPLSFAKVFAQSTDSIQQGSFRRGANMGMMSVHRPDILNFIYAKTDLTQLTNFNLSVKITNTFMQQLITAPDSMHIVVNPRTKVRYCIPRTVRIGAYTIKDLIPEKDANDNCIRVIEIWKHIIRSAHATGEPGVCYIDNINANNPTPNLGAIEATNPCGEQPLLDFEACTLGSLNLPKFVRKNGNNIDWDWLAKTAKLAVRFLDNIIDVNFYPVAQIRDITLGNRKIGLGVMGFHDMLFLLGIRYNSEDAERIAEQVAGFIQEHAHKASEELAQERGCFPNWEGSLWQRKYNRPIRNATLTTIAPTGTTSNLGECNGGIEPFFSLFNKRRALEGQEFYYFIPIIEKLGKEQGWLTDKVKQQLIEGIKPRDIPEIPSEVAKVLVTAHEIAPEWHVRIQAAFQRHLDNSVSKTVNLPANATLEDVDNIYRFAYKLNTKGITVYRDGCRENQVITKANPKTLPNPEKTTPRSRSRRTKGETTKYTMGCGKLYVTVNKDKKGLCEVFANLGKAGGCPAQSKATCRIASAAIRSGVEPTVLIEQLKGIRCLSTVSRRKTNKDIDVLSCPDAIAKAIEESLGQTRNLSANSENNKCPDCGLILRYESGCDVCSCGYSSCG
jgi:ribonucleoside-diphosphate reductase alpha chain